MSDIAGELLDANGAFDRSVEGTLEGGALMLVGELLDATGVNTLANIGRILFGTGILLTAPAITAVVTNIYHRDERPQVHPQG